VKAPAYLLGLVFFLFPLSLAAEESAEPQDPWALCRENVDVAERLVSIPRYLLSAISSVESGRWSEANQARISWPWTVMAEGRGRYLPSKSAAIAEVRALQAKGVRNIDVGCMQINLLFHGDAFVDLEQAFDPAFNVAYAAAFLLRLREEERSWTRAIGRYHSATPVFANRYKTKVRRAWQAEKRDAARRLRDQRNALQEAARLKRRDQQGDSTTAG
jgi:hypothetical protein